MNIINFLKSRIGAISKVGLVGASVSAGLMGLSVVSYMTSSPSVQDQKIRSLASIMTSGQELPKGYEQFKTMNFSRGAAEFASAEERAKMEGTFDGGDSQVAAIDGLNIPSGVSVEGIGNIQGQAFSGGEGGLGFNNDKGSESRGGQAAFAAQRGDVSGVEGAAEGASRDATAGGKTLTRASITKVNAGSNMPASAPGTFGSASHSSAAQERQNRVNPASIGASSISGAMPGGSTLVARSPKFEGAHAGSSSFLGGSRDGRVRPGAGLNSKEGNSLRQMAKTSADVAANAHRAAGEGAFAVFMNGESRAGITLDDGGMTTGTTFGGEGDESFGQNLDKKIGDIGKAIDESATKEAERKAKRSALGKELIGMLFATIAAMLAISSLMSGDPTGIGKAIAAVIACLMWVWIGTYMARAGIFARDYDNDPVGIVFAVIAGIFAVGIAISFIPAVANGIMDKIVTPVLDGLGMSGSGGVASLGLSPATQGFEGMISNSKELAQGSEDGSSVSNEGQKS